MNGPVLDKSGALTATEAEYALKQAEMLKGEIVHHQRYLYNSTLANFVGLPALLSLSSEFDFTIFNLLLPLIVTFLMYLPVYYQNAIIRCARYVRYVIEPKLLSANITGYENYLEDDGFGRVPEIYFRSVTTMAFTIYFMFALGLSANDAIGRGWKPYRELANFLAAGWTDRFYDFYFLAVVIFFVFSGFYIRRTWRTHSASMPSEAKEPLFPVAKQPETPQADEATTGSDEGSSASSNPPA